MPETLTPIPDAAPEDITAQEELSPIETALEDSRDAINNPYRYAAVDTKTGNAIGVEDVRAHKIAYAYNSGQLEKGENGRVVSARDISVELARSGHKPKDGKYDVYENLLQRYEDEHAIDVEGEPDTQTESLKIGYHEMKYVALADNDGINDAIDELHGQAVDTLNAEAGNNTGVDNKQFAEALFTANVFESEKLHREMRAREDGGSEEQQARSAQLNKEYNIWARASEGEPINGEEENIIRRKALELRKAAAAKADSPSAEKNIDSEATPNSADIEDLTRYFAEEQQTLASLEKDEGKKAKLQKGFEMYKKINRQVLAFAKERIDSESLTQHLETKLAEEKSKGNVDGDLLEAIDAAAVFVKHVRKYWPDSAVKKALFNGYQNKKV